jgi:hypothetical protein
MESVLVAFRDQVLYLKHNPNAQAVAALEGAAVEIERDIDVLIRDLHASIEEADRFLEALEESQSEIEARALGLSVGGAKTIASGWIAIIETAPKPCDTLL